MREVRKMRQNRLFAAFLCVVILLALVPVPASAEGTITEVGTVAELRAALESEADAHVRLTGDITFTKADAFDGNYGVMTGHACYTLDLNGFTLKYNYRTGGELSENGSPIVVCAKLLTVNGPGTIIGGTNGIEQWDQFGSLVINGGTIKGVMGNGVRMTGGITYINGGILQGNFSSIEAEDGIVVLNGGDVKKVSLKGHYPPQKRGVIRDGVFTGDTTLEDIVLFVDNLTIAQGSSVKIVRGGGLVVKNSFVNNGTFTFESGLQCIAGEALIKSNTQEPQFQVDIFRDISFNNLTILRGAALRIQNGATVSVAGAFRTEPKSNVVVVDGELKLLGSIDHNGNAIGVLELDIRMQERHKKQADAAMHLRNLGLFFGVGTNPDGSINFDLGRKPSRVEALVMLLRLTGREEIAKEGDWEHPFTDVPEWAQKQIGYAYENGITAGVSSTEFGTGTSSVQMYLTFVLKALGYSADPGGDFVWDKSEELARSVGILPPDVNLDNFTRGDMVLVSEAALNAKLKDSDMTLLERLVSEGVVTPP